MKKMKKLFAVILSLAMVLGMCMVTSAAPEGSKKPEAKDHETATVSNVEKDANIIAYRIVEPQYNDNGFYGFKRASGLTEADLKDPLKPESNEVTKIAQRLMDTENPLTGLLSNEQLNTITGLETIGSNTFTAGTADEKGLATFTAELTPGYWVVIVTGSEIQEIYNPMLVGVYYDKTGSGSNSVVQTDPVDANTSWDLTTTGVYAKSEPPTIDKSITTEDTNTDESANSGSGNDVAIGDTVSFLIDTQIPSYSKSYKEVSVKIKDTMGQGLVLAENPNIVVKVNGNEDENIVPATDPETNKTNYTISYPDPATKNFQIAFESEYALAHSGQKVYVTYDAVLTADAAYNFNANVNKASLEYTNDPTGETNEIDDRTYTYTFGIDASINGLKDDITKEVWKTGSRLVNGQTEKFGLNGAIFALTREDGKVYYTESGKGEVTLDKDGNVTPKENGFRYPTDANGKYDGYLAFKGLDVGKYTLQEIKAPDGWSLNNAEIPVEIQATYNTDGTLKSYSILVNGTVIDGEENGKKDSTYNVGEYKADPVSEDKIPVNQIENPESDTQEIPNTQLSELPSTGGIGTTIFTIGGCVIMIAAAALFFASRKKSQK